MDASRVPVAVATAPRPLNGHAGGAFPRQSHAPQREQEEPLRHPQRQLSARELGTTTPIGRRWTSQVGSPATFRRSGISRRWRPLGAPARDGRSLWPASRPPVDDPQRQPSAAAPRDGLKVGRAPVVQRQCLDADDRALPAHPEAGGPGRGEATRLARVPRYPVPAGPSDAGEPRAVPRAGRRAVVPVTHQGHGRRRLLQAGSVGLRRRRHPLRPRLCGDYVRLQRACPTCAWGQRAQGG